MSLLFCAVRQGQLGMHPVQCVLCHRVAQCRPVAPPRRWPWVGMATAARASWPEAVVHVRACVGEGVNSSTSRAARDIRSRRAHRAPALPPNMGSGPWRVASVLRLAANRPGYVCVCACVALCWRAACSPTTTSDQCACAAPRHTPNHPAASSQRVCRGLGLAIAIRACTRGLRCIRTQSPRSG